jgi:hypothetical protein
VKIYNLPNPNPFFGLEKLCFGCGVVGGKNIFLQSHMYGQRVWALGSVSSTAYQHMPCSFLRAEPILCLVNQFRNETTALLATKANKLEKPKGKEKKNSA